MKYMVRCPKCESVYEVEMDFAPEFCVKCGFELIKVSPVRTKSRITAEAKMAELDEIQPRLAKAREEYFTVRVEYEDALQYLAQYHKRGIVSDDEYARYKIKEQNLTKDLNARLKEHRTKKKEREEA